MNNDLKLSFENNINESINLLKELKKSFKKINKYVDIIHTSLSNNGKVLICGNGGSAADATHFAAEFIGRFSKNINRKPLPCISLNTDTSSITAISNDFNFSDIFSRQLEALGNKKDILITLSTSGNSSNIINLIKKSKELKIKTINFIGSNGGKSLNLSNEQIIINSENTARVQEIHMFLLHTIINFLEIKYYS